MHNPRHLKLHANMHDINHHCHTDNRVYRTIAMKKLPKINEKYQYIASGYWIYFFL